MLTYIIRRLLYSIVVLILASFLVFSFVVKGAGDPLAHLRVTPNVSHETVERIAEGEAPQRLDPAALLVLGARKRSRTSSERRSSRTSRSCPTSGG